MLSIYLTLLLIFKGYSFIYLSRIRVKCHDFNHKIQSKSISTFNLIRSTSKEDVDVRITAHALNDTLSPTSIIDEGTMLISSDVVRVEVNNIIENIVSRNELLVQRIKWTADRIEVIVCNNDTTTEALSPPLGTLENIHRSIFDELDKREDELQIVSRFEVI